jgi:diguanylate cyclase (GGDEF)-like protein/PAS domain S-box-containing protein
MAGSTLDVLAPKGVRLEDLPFGERFFEKLLDNLYDGVYFVDRTRRILFWNEGAQRLSGYSREEVVGSYCFENTLIHTDENGCHLCEAGCPLVKTIETGLPVSKRVFLRHKDQRRIAVDAHVMPLRDDRGEIVGGIEIFRDASSMVALEKAYEQLRELAVKDPLTGISNRRALDQLLDDQMALLKRTGIPFSLIMADIDHFKQVNDTYGHSVGDLALVRFAHQMQEQCRKTDVLGRFGGDEFLVVLRQQGLEAAVRAAERLCAAAEASAPKELAERGLTASFGVTEATLPDTVQSLLERVDAALYQAKDRGRNRVEAASWFSSALR